MLVSVLLMPLIRRMRSSTEARSCRVSAAIPAASPAARSCSGYAGLAQQAGNHGAGLVAVHRDAHPGLDPVVAHIRAQPHGVANDDAVVLQSADAVGHRAARDLQFGCQRGHAQARVLAQQRDQFLVDFIHSDNLSCHFAKFLPFFIQN
jgi:hypothetical protein